MIVELKLTKIYCKHFARMICKIIRIIYRNSFDTIDLSNLFNDTQIECFKLDKKILKFFLLSGCRFL